MAIETRKTDSKARVTLPGHFADSTVIVEQLSDTEVRIRKAVVIPEEELRFQEEASTPLSGRDRDLFLDLLDNSPLPNEALLKAARKFKSRGG